MFIFGSIEKWSDKVELSEIWSNKGTAYRPILSLFCHLCPSLKTLKIDIKTTKTES